MTIISILNQKGGVGKTTTAAALHNALTLKGYKVLAIDADAQRNLSQTFGADTKDDTATLIDVLLGTDITSAIQHTPQGDIIAANKRLANIDQLYKGTGKFNALKEAIRPLKQNLFSTHQKDAYDFIIIDTPPAIGTLLLNALMLTDYAVITLEADIFSLSALEDITANLQDAQGYNDNLKIAGILLTRFTGRATLSKQLRETFTTPAAEIGTIVFKTPIRENIAVKEAHIMRQSLYDYAPKSNAAIDYMDFTEELLKIVKKGAKKK